MAMSTCINSKFWQSFVIICVKTQKVDKENLPLLQRNHFNLFCEYFIKVMTMPTSEVYLGPNTYDREFFVFL